MQVKSKPIRLIQRIPTGRYHGVSQIYTEVPKYTRYPGALLVELRKQKGVGNVRKIKVVQ